jgi:predicted helicase
VLVNLTVDEKYSPAHCAYWEDCAKDVAEIAVAQQTRIHALLKHATPAIGAAFDKFLDALRANLNDSINRNQAIEMLSQHPITKPGVRRAIRRL